VKIEGRERVELPRERVFAALDDPAVLRACTPGLTRLEQTAPDRYEATLEIQLPAITGRFEGSVVILEREAPERMRLQLAGKGAPGFVNGTAELRLAEADAGTEVAYTADVQVGGQVARLGQRMLSGVSKELAGQFFEAFQAAAAGGAPDAEGSVAAPRARSPIPAGLQLLWRTLLNLLGLSKRS
jgi:carbon monoxide dehydrogenase subunit G